MNFEVIMPDLGATGGDVTLNEWLVKPGDLIEAGQPLFVVTTDKATVEVEAFRDGIIREIKVSPGEAVPHGTVVALLDDSIDEDAILPDRKDLVSLDASKPVRKQVRLPSTMPRDDRILASPLAKRMAEAEEINLQNLSGTGAQGQILKRDVLAAVNKRDSSQTVLPPISTKRETLTPMRRAIAERAQRSKSEAPHFYATITIDMLAALELRHQAGEVADKRGWTIPTITDICIRATSLTLLDYPALNSSIDGETIITYSDINIGLVISLDEGMLIPVLHRADRLNLYALAAETKRLRDRSLAGHFSASEMSGGTFTISNLGMFGLDSFTAVINPPEVGILALGAVKEQPTVVEGTIISRPLMTATLSVDHRVVDGIIAARFADTLKEKLENPLRLLLDGPQVIDP